MSAKNALEGLAPCQFERPACAATEILPAIVLCRTVGVTDSRRNNMIVVLRPRYALNLHGSLKKRPSGCFGACF